jgi:Ser/Thr protein kinase RdoA (MazF antagonist)
MDSSIFQERIGYKGDLGQFFRNVVGDYELGSLISYDPILQGYEDFNVKVETDSGKYLFKVMGGFRSDKEVQQYADIIETVVNNGIAHPKIYKSEQGNLYRKNFDGTEMRLVVMDFVDGKDFFQLKEKPTREEAIFLVGQSAKISKINLKPEYVYDSWAIPNFLKEYNEIKDKLDLDDLKYVGPLASNFSELEIEKLPHCFVHGDLIATNVIRSNNNGLHIIDFAVANYYPRIQELAVLLCDLLFIEDKEKYLENYKLVLETYQKDVKLEQREIELLPTFIKLAHAMHIVPATREKVKGNLLPENDFWLNSGQKGIRLASEIWG